MIELFGIKNCDTMKKARAWLEAHSLTYRFHDYARDGIDAGMLGAWVSQVGWEALLNRAGTTFRSLPEADKADLTEVKAIALMTAKPSMIKRPVLLSGTRILVGFQPERYEKLR